MGLAEDNQRINANQFQTEKLLAELLLHCNIPNQSPDDLEHMAHWWQKEWVEYQNSQPPIARAFLEIYCLAVEDDKFVIYWLDEINWWFSAIGEIIGELSVTDFNNTLEQLVKNFEHSLK